MWLRPHSFQDSTLHLHSWWTIFMMMKDATDASKVWLPTWVRIALCAVTSSCLRKPRRKAENNHLTFHAIKYTHLLPVTLPSTVKWKGCVVDCDHLCWCKSHPFIITAHPAHSWCLCTVQVLCTKVWCRRMHRMDTINSFTCIMCIKRVPSVSGKCSCDLLQHQSWHYYPQMHDWQVQVKLPDIQVCFSNQLSVPCMFQQLRTWLQMWLFPQNLACWNVMKMGFVTQSQLVRCHIAAQMSHDISLAVFLQEDCCHCNDMWHLKEQFSESEFGKQRPHLLNWWQFILFFCSLQWCTVTIWPLDCFCDIIQQVMLLGHWQEQCHADSVHQFISPEEKEVLTGSHRHLHWHLRSIKPPHTQAIHQPRALAVGLVTLHQIDSCKPSGAKRALHSKLHACLETLCITHLEQWEGSQWPPNSEQQVVHQVANGDILEVRDHMRPRGASYPLGAQQIHPLGSGDDQALVVGHTTMRFRGFNPVDCPQGVLQICQLLPQHGTLQIPLLRDLLNCHQITLHVPLHRTQWIGQVAHPCGTLQICRHGALQTHPLGSRQIHHLRNLRFRQPGTPWIHPLRCLSICPNGTLQICQQIILLIRPLGMQQICQGFTLQIRHPGNLEIAKLWAHSETCRSTMSKAHFEPCKFPISDPCEFPCLETCRFSNPETCGFPCLETLVTPSRSSCLFPCSECVITAKVFAPEPPCRFAKTLAHTQPWSFPHLEPHRIANTETCWFFNNPTNWQPANFSSWNPVELPTRSPADSPVLETRCWPRDDPQNQPTMVPWNCPTSPPTQTLLMSPRNIPVKHTSDGPSTTPKFLPRFPPTNCPKTVDCRFLRRFHLKSLVMSLTVWNC